jgi:uncharacterized membrane protein YgdD (TMEM256/DUF423 family)
MQNLFLILAGVNGFIAVSLGAFAAHGLRDRLGADLLATFQTGVQYQMYHALALFGIGLLALNFPGATLVRVSGYLFLGGIILFSGSLYFLSLTGTRWVGAITPIGGVAFLAGWGTLIWFLIKSELSS